MCFVFQANAQNKFPTQTLRGEIRDAANGDFLTGATAEIELDSLPKGAVANEKGNFRFDSIPIGRYKLQVRFLGYKTLIIPELSVESGKEVVQNIWLEKSPESLEQVVVSSSGRSNREVQSISSHTLTVEETFRFPATFNDPARLAMSYPGVVGTDDQANGLSIRGNSPAAMQWRLEGVEIVNPNHLSNAGTQSDLGTTTSGGVNILSAQMLATSNLHTGAFPVEYGNVLGGIMDMNLRIGNNEKHEYTLKAGLNGFEFAAEGPFSEKSKKSFLFNYRYSFVGLLTSMGVDFGGEKIKFSDFSMHINLPTKKAGTFSIFGMGGASQNLFEKPDSAIIEKDLQSVRFNSTMAALGMKHQIALKNSFWTSTLAYSAGTTEQSFDFDLININFPFDIFIFNRDEFISNNKLSFLTKIDRNLSKTKVNYGVAATVETVDYYSSYGSLFFIRPFVNWTWQLSPKTELKTGVGLPYFHEAKTLFTEPNLELNYQYDSNQKLSFKSSLHSQYFFPEILIYDDGHSRLINPDLTPSRSWHSVFGYQNQSKSGTVFQAEFYYQKLFDLPISDHSISTYSAINYQDGRDWRFLSLESEGTGTNVGLDVFLRKFLTEKFYFLAAGSLYNSTYRAGDQVQRNTRFNGNYTLNFTSGYEFHKKKASKLRTFGVNLRAVLAGGKRYTPIKNFRSDLNSPEAFSRQLKGYFRTDLRVYLKWNRPKLTSVLALDIQNLTNRKNEAYFYFDSVQNDVILREQLGLIPNLSYQVDF